MSRPASYHDTQVDNGFDHGGFSLPLFNNPPSASNHLHAHPEYSVTQTHNLTPQTNTVPPPHRNSIHISPRQHQAPVMQSSVPYSAHPYPHSRGQDELIPPPSAASGFGSLARSASLGARKKDPYSYASDDVESGLGNMDMGDTIHSNGNGNGSGALWGGYGAGSRAPAPLSTGLYAASPIREASSPSAGSSRAYAPTMQPPPVPSHLSRPPPIPGQIRRDSGSPSKANYQIPAIANPYIPRGSDPGPSPQPNLWASSGPSQRIPSGASMNSPLSSAEHMSPYSIPSGLATSPELPLVNPYDASPNLAPPTFDAQLQMPSPPSSSQWGTYTPSSPAGRAPLNLRSQSHQSYPSSQPVTPAYNRSAYDPPMRNDIAAAAEGSRGRVRSRHGLRDVNHSSDLRPVINSHPNGRRADPVTPGKYLSPLKCLTAALPQTYTLCNPAFRYESSENPRRVLTKPSKPVHNDGADNEDWDYILYVNDVLGGENGGDRYLILDVLGQGTFGQVVKCQNMRNHEIVAVKVVKNKPAYLNQSKMEVAILDLLNTQHDPRDEHHILRLLESFTHKSHLCLVFECLSSNLYELIKQNQFKGLSTQLVKVFTQQLLECLAVLKDARLIHCDLKPENILLKSLQSPQIKIIDFGSACHEMQTVYTYIQSRFYRSPEVLLGLPYSTSIDMWSLGCIVVELFLGLPLFPGTSEYNQVSRIVDMLGNPPEHLLAVGKQTHEFFHVSHDHHGRKLFQLKSRDQYAAEHRTNEQPSKQYFKQTKLNDIIMEYPYAKKNAKQSDIDKEMAHRRAFVDFVEGLLNLDPIKRWTPQQAAKHPFITGEKFTGPFQPIDVPAQKKPATAFPTPEKTVSPSKKYGGLVQSPSARGGQRIYSDAAAYNQQLAQHQAAYNAQAASRQSFAGDYPQQTLPQATVYGTQQRIPSSQQIPPPPQPNWNQPRQNMPPPQGQYQPRIPSQGVPSSSSHSGFRPMQQTMAPTNPPPNSYYPASRNRANTINQMDAIPPALARLTHFGMADPSGTRNLTPVLNRDEAIREWERRHHGGGGHSKQPSMHNPNYAQLELLQEQAELASMGGQNWMMPGQYGHVQPISAPMHGAHGNHVSTQMSGHRPSISTGNYAMQPHIGITPDSPTAASPYRSRGQYEPPPLSANASSRSFLPAYPPPAATGAGNVNLNSFDAFDSRDPSMGMLYTPLQPSYQSASAGATPHGHGHTARASFSGPYHNGSGGSAGSNNPFGGSGSGGESPRYQRRSQGGYGV